MMKTIEIITLNAALAAFPSFAQAFTLHEKDYPTKEKKYSPYVDRHFPQNVYFGDTHLHTSWSADAGLAGASLGPEFAYRVARGEQVTSQTGLPFKLVRPLDFVVVADHAENIGIYDYLDRADPLLLETEVGRRWKGYFEDGKGIEAAYQWSAANARGEDPIGSPEMTARVWGKVIENADNYYEPGVFTTFIGFEWTSGPGSNNLHRNVIFRDGKDWARQVVPFSAFDSDDPEDLWAYLQAYEDKTGGRVLAIPHNGNLSNGVMFMLETFDGKAFDTEYAQRRQRFERVVEVTQPKGTGEAPPFLSPNDEFANFEPKDKSNLTGAVAKTNEMLKTKYASEALKLGLAEEARLGVNPFKFRMIGSTDSHNAIPSTREENWFGKIYFVEPSPHRRDGVFIDSKVDPKYSIRDVDMGGSGLAAVWATENTREAIWDAFARREIFATTGSRLRVRVFAGWDFEESEVQRPDFDPKLKAFYYVRVIEIPTPRWTAYDAKFCDIEMPEGTAMEVTDQASVIRPNHSGNRTSTSATGQEWKEDLLRFLPSIAERRTLRRTGSSATAVAQVCVSEFSSEFRDVRQRCRR